MGGARTWSAQRDSGWGSCDHNCGHQLVLFPWRAGPPWRTRMCQAQVLAHVRWTARSTIPVLGMTCAACQARVQQALSRSAGVRDAVVNLMTGQATVAFDPHVASPAMLVDAIRATGYGAELPTEGRTAFGEQEAFENAAVRELHATKQKAIIALCAAILAMLLSMPVSMNVFGAGPCRWALLGLTTAIMAWVGRHFYVGAWKALRHHSADMNTLIAAGTGAAYGFSTGGHALSWRARDTWSRPWNVYFEAVIWIIALILVGNALEGRAKEAKPLLRSVG